MVRANRIGKSWSLRYRTINGRRRRVKVRKIGGREQVRMIGYRNLVDKTAKRLGRKRIKNYYNTTDHTKRVQHPTGKKYLIKYAKKHKLKRRR